MPDKPIKIVKPSPLAGYDSFSSTWDSSSYASLNDYVQFVTNTKPMPTKVAAVPTTTLDTPPSKRVSVFGHIYVSTEPQWTFYKGAGWVFETELSTFTQRFAQCSQGYDPESWFPTKEMTPTWEGKYVHPKRARQLKWVKCVLTGHLSPPEDMVEAHNGSNVMVKMSMRWMKKHGVAVRICEVSGLSYFSQFMVEVKSAAYTYVGQPALKSSGYFACCESCGTWCDKAMVPHRPALDEYLCNKCYGQKTKKGVILKHDAKEYPNAVVSATQRFGHSEKDGLIISTGKKEALTDVRLFGVELETELHLSSVKKAGLDRFTIASSIKEVLGTDFVMTKEDGTLNMNGKYSDSDGPGPHYAGFEIVSAPASMAVHREKWAKLLGVEGFKHLRAWDTTTCGFHVHVSREALTTAQIERILRLVNHPKNQRFIQTIAGRGQHNYCRYDGRVYAEATKKGKVGWDKRALTVEPRTNENRRQSVNLCNPNTVEFRIFRGTVNPVHVIRNLEFVNAICDFSYPCLTGLKESGSRKHFMRFVSVNRKRYPNLASWMVVQNMIKTRAPGVKANKEKMTIQLDKVEEAEIKLDQQLGGVPAGALANVPEIEPSNPTVAVAGVVNLDTELITIDAPDDDSP